MRGQKVRKHVLTFTPWPRYNQPIRSSHLFDPAHHLHSLFSVKHCVLAITSLDNITWNVGQRSSGQGHNLKCRSKSHQVITSLYHITWNVGQRSSVQGHNLKCWSKGHQVITSLYHITWNVGQRSPGQGHNSGKVKYLKPYHQLRALWTDQRSTY